jgi:hypothetical protein
MPSVHAFKKLKKKRKKEGKPLTIIRKKNERYDDND